MNWNSHAPIQWKLGKLKNLTKAFVNILDYRSKTVENMIISELQKDFHNFYLILLRILHMYTYCKHTHTVKYCNAYCNAYCNTHYHVQSENLTKN